MGEIVLGIGSSHTFMLSEDASDWGKHGDLVDRRVGALTDASGKRRQFDELVAQQGPTVLRELTEEVYRQKAAASQRALDRLALDIKSAKLDALIVFGDDQRELFAPANTPAILIYCGNTIAKHRHTLPGPPPPRFLTDAIDRHFGEAMTGLPIATTLAGHLVDYFLDNHFDPAVSLGLPDGIGEGHAFAFIHTRLMDAGAPIPLVPIMINTYYPPNQPRAERCFEYGEAVREAVEGLDDDLRVGVVASGGLSHFWVDVGLDTAVLEAIRTHDIATLLSIPRSKLESGTSEILNWIALYGATRHLKQKWSEYIPGFRTEAGTGTGLAFGTWE